MDLLVELSKIDLIAKIDSAKAEVDSYRPFSKETDAKIFQKFRLDWNYHSNSIEGNPYTYGETAAFILNGITAKGKKLKDHLDIAGHNEAIDFLLSLVKSDRGITETGIRSLHALILKEPYEVDAITENGEKTKKLISIGKYKTSANHVQTATGETHFYSSPEETPILMGELVEWLRKVENSSNVHPLITASLFHHKFVEIHPFDDGNGRLGRILMNFIFLKHGYPPVVLKTEKRNEYYAALSQADNKELLPLIELIGEELLNSLNLQLKGAKGQEIIDDRDLDKEIALLKKSFQVKGNEKSEKTNEVVKNALLSTIFPLLKSIFEKCLDLNDLFVSNEVDIGIETDWGELSNDLDLLDYKKWTDKNSNNLENLSKIEIIYTWKRFRHVKDFFDFPILLEVEVEQSQFRITANQKIVPDKNYYAMIAQLEISYNEYIGTDSIRKFRDKVIKKILSEIKRIASGSE